MGSRSRMDACKGFSDAAACFRYTLHVLTWHRGDSSKIINKYLHNKIQALVYLWLEKPNIAGVDAFTELVSLIVCPRFTRQLVDFHVLCSSQLQASSDKALGGLFFNLLTAPSATEEKKGGFSSVQGAARTTRSLRTAALVVPSRGRSRGWSAVLCRAAP